MFVLLAPLLVFVVPWPGPAVSMAARAAVAGILYVAAFCYGQGRASARRLDSSRAGLITGVLAACVLSGGVGALLLPSAPSPVAAAAALLLAAVAWGVYSGASARIRGAGVLSLALVLGSVLCVESALRAVPPRRFYPEISQVPPLAPGNRGNQIYRKNGFRGRRPCRDCPEELIRIVTMGGSSTYGIPMFYRGDTYSAALQRMLDERRPAEQYEVLNGGIPGYGIMQILDSLEKEILKLRPDIVTICAWFNDSSHSMSWWGYADKTDREAYQMIRMLQWVENLPGFRAIESSRLYGLFRFYLLKGRTAAASRREPEERIKQPPRSNPEEFRWGIERAIDLLLKHDVLPVLVLEPLNHTAGLEEAARRNQYYRAMIETARERGIPLVDTLTPLSAARDQWLFHDFIHPNREGHRIIAESIFAALHSATPAPRLERFWSERGVPAGRRAVTREAWRQFPTESLRRARLSIRASMPAGETSPRQLEVLVNGRSARGGFALTEAEQEFAVTFDGMLDDAPPISEIVVRLADSAGGAFVMGEMRVAPEKPLQELK